MVPAQVMWRVDLHCNGLLNVILGGQGPFDPYDLHDNSMTMTLTLTMTMSLDFWPNDT